MQAIILAAGKGERMRPLTLKTPKPLLKVHGKPLIEHHIERLAASGITHIVINVCWLAEQIIDTLGNGEKWGVNIQFSHEGEEPLETGGGILKALPLLQKSQHFIVVNGDIKTNYDFKKLNLIQPEYAHLVLVKNPTHHQQGDFSIQDKQTLCSHSEPKFTFSGIGKYNRKLFENCQHGAFKLAPLLKQHMQNKLISGEYFNDQWDDIGTVERLDSINSPKQI